MLPVAFDWLTEDLDPRIASRPYGPRSQSHRRAPHIKQLPYISTLSRTQLSISHVVIFHGTGHGESMHSLYTDKPKQWGRLAIFYGHALPVPCTILSGVRNDRPQEVRESELACAVGCSHA